MKKQAEVKVSVLVPIYNVEKYLPECLESLTAQTLAEMEIICINDGSTDGSLEIVKRFAKKDPRFVIIDKKNSGYGDSMNRGLERARGEYVGIVESDDYTEPEAFAKMYALAKRARADVVRANYYHHTEKDDKKFYYVELADANRVVKPLEAEWIFYQAPAIWSAIYRREFLEKNQIKFLPTPGASYQDTGFNFKVWATAERAYFTTDAFLHYRLDNSSSSVNNPGKVLCACEEYAEIEKYLRERGLYDRLAEILLAAKFGGYFWNIYRLNPRLLPDFLDRVRQEYQAALDEGREVTAKFVAPEHEELLRRILEGSNRSVVRYVRRKGLMHRWRDRAKRAWLATHPTYRKQQAVAELITELQSENEQLQEYIKELEKTDDGVAADEKKVARKEKK